MRHLSRDRRQTINGHARTTAEIIREACHEVQWPVLYAIAIIITAYMPIFTLAARRRPLVSAYGPDCRSNT